MDRLDTIRNVLGTAAILIVTAVAGYYGPSEVSDAGGLQNLSTVNSSVGGEPHDTFAVTFAGVADEALTVAEPTTHDPQTAKTEVDRVWTCARDFSKDRSCTAVATNLGVELDRETLPIPESDLGCTRTVCSALFERKFSKLANAYVHEGD